MQDWRRGRHSDISGFHRLEPERRLEIVRRFANLSDAEVAALLNGLTLTTANRMIENVIGVFGLPLGIGTNFLIDGKDFLVPMVVEESSVVAAASNAAKLCRPSGGFKTSADGPVMIGQIQLTGVNDFECAKRRLEDARDELFRAANAQDSTLVRLGGGLKDFEVRRVDSDIGAMLIVHLLVDVKDAMGANAVNTIAERVAPVIEQIVGGRVGLRIVSNLATARLARATAVWKKDVLERSFENSSVSGDEIVDGVIAAWHFAKADPYRCATHNKGIMNGVDAVMIACGNDWRAAEAGAHTYSRLLGKPLTWYEKTPDGDLRGHIELPLAAGIVGGATKINPCARACLKILGVRSAQELARVAAAVGLANNFAALRALCTEGIQKGHMKLHAANIAVEAGAHGDEIERVAWRMIEERKISVSRAKEIILEVRGLK
ncbi:MAG: hydroxymethylglutaryl-CoA reductase, degradative [Candidatus Aenigmatarchaeota archaeon]